MTLIYKNKSFVESVLCYSKRIFIFYNSFEKEGREGGKSEVE